MQAGHTSPVEKAALPMTTVLLTGMPRSGTTLACAMLNEHPDTVALLEPMLIAPHGDRGVALAQIDAFVGRARESLLRDRTAPSKHRDGLVPDNSVGADRIVDGLLRPVDVERSQIRFDKPLSRNFRLVVKHPALFTALARDLAPRYPLYAIIRDPLSVLASWQTVDMNIQRGQMPMAEAFSPRLAASLATVRPALERQVVIMEWMLRTYLVMPRHRVIRYEDILAVPASTLAAISGVMREPSVIRHRHEAQTRYPGVPLAPLADALLPILPLARVFYPDFAATLAAARA